MILCIETATSVCSVALCDRERIISFRENTEGLSHAALLTVFINEILSEQNIKAGELEAIAVSKGPGSFTGLRIGVSVAKGIAFRASIPLIGIDTLVSMFHGVSPETRKRFNLTGTSLFCPMIDARRMEVYYALIGNDGKMTRETGAGIITPEYFNDIPSDTKILFFGNGAGKCRDLISRPDIYFDDTFRISAQNMRIPAYKAFDSGSFEDVAYFEPFYLKDFIATVPRNSITGKKEA